MTLLFTGASGFLGRNTLPKLREVYGSVTTLGLSDGDDISVDLGRTEPVLPGRYDVVLHAAGLAHVEAGNHEDAQAFFDVNYQGTVNLCRALEKVGMPKSLVFISTVAVYGCEEGENISEEHPLEGTSPYAKSNIMAEKFLGFWCAEKGVTLTILRPALMAGPDAPGNLGAMVRGIRKGFYFNISGGHARKSLLMAGDIANIVPLVAEKGGVYNVCDSYSPSYGELASCIARQLAAKEPKSIPYPLARLAAAFGDLLGPRFPLTTPRLRKLTRTLTFSNAKIIAALPWRPLPVLDNYRVK